MSELFCLFHTSGATPAERQTTLPVLREHRNPDWRQERCVPDSDGVRRLHQELLLLLRITVIRLLAAGHVC